MGVMCMVSLRSWRIFPCVNTCCDVHKHYFEGYLHVNRMSCMVISEGGRYRETS